MAAAWRKGGGGSFRDGVWYANQLHTELQEAYTEDCGSSLQWREKTLHVRRCSPNELLESGDEWHNLLGDGILLKDLREYNGNQQTQQPRWTFPITTPEVIGEWFEVRDQ